ncbi:MAG TPA: SDR family oxidoreductase [Alphaproteobacteria bacterium]|jgi:NAD(P)-dependent dehydrogenase (short-subunit alcohol dehydrogenase family)|nr:SDR family oxidoreductase [Alphaproteobacteria bacterium]
MPIKDVSGQSLQQLISLEGRAAVITGAGRGIGLAIARRLTEAGADVLIGDIDAASAEASAAALSKEFGRRVVGTALNVGEEASIIALADRAVAEFGKLDIWVNNAGIFPGSPTVDQTVEIWDRVQDINLRGSFIGAREAGRRMLAQTPTGGVIVNIASVSGYSGRPGLAAYVASKHGVIGLTKSLGVEWGPHGIRVLGIAPTGISTPGVDERKAQATGAELERILELEKKVGEALPLRRLGVPDDIARVVLFCASDLSMLMTGSVVLVDAGALAN